MALRDPRRAPPGPSLIYVDSSALVKLVVERPETASALDAIHLATALDGADALEGLVTYDARLGAAAAAAGLEVLTPGA